MSKNESICRKCFHSYVCEQFNKHRDDDNQKCHFFNDHFVSSANVIVQEQGEWIVSEYPSHLDVKCSVCGGSFYVHNKGQYRIEQSNYCPNCGAKMDGRE